MAWRTKNYKLTSEAPLIQHNGELADPLNPIVKEIKKLSGKRSKTEADLEALAKLEFLGGLYVDKDLGIVVPADCLEATVINGAKKSRHGMVAKTGMFVEKHSKLIYEGPQNPEDLWQDKDFVFRKLVVVQRARIARTRPIFNSWELEATINYEDSIVDENQLSQWIKTAGMQVGLCDWRPRYGRFSVE